MTGVRDPGRGSDVTSVKMPEVLYVEGISPVNALLETLSQRRAGKPSVMVSSGPLHSTSLHQSHDQLHGAHMVVSTRLRTWATIVKVESGSGTSCQKIWTDGKHSTCWRCRCFPCRRRESSDTRQSTSSGCRSNTAVASRLSTLMGCGSRARGAPQAGALHAEDLQFGQAR